MNTKVCEVSRLHKEAMRFADESTVARLLDDREEYLRCTRLAFEKEAEAAQLMVGENIEPTRSVLHRSEHSLLPELNAPHRPHRLSQPKRAPALIGLDPDHLDEISFPSLASCREIRWDWLKLPVPETISARFSPKRSKRHSGVNLAWINPCLYNMSITWLGCFAAIGESPYIPAAR